MSIILKYLPIVLLLLIIVVLVYAVVRAAQGPRAPFSYTQREYQSARATLIDPGGWFRAAEWQPGVYAPGETLVYSAGLTIERDGHIEVTRGFRTYPREELAMLCDGTNALNIVYPPEKQPAPFSFGAIGLELERRITVPVPNLRPGEYLLISSVYKKDGGEAVTRVRFVVTQECRL